MVRSAQLAARRRAHRHRTRRDGAAHRPQPPRIVSQGACGVVYFAPARVGSADPGLLPEEGRHAAARGRGAKARAETLQGARIELLVDDARLGAAAAGEAR